MRNVYRVGKKLATTIYRDDDQQPCAWIPGDPALAIKIVSLLNSDNISENPSSSSVVPDHPPW